VFFGVLNHEANEQIYTADLSTMNMTPFYANQSRVRRVRLGFTLSAIGSPTRAAINNWKRLFVFIDKD